MGFKPQLNNMAEDYSYQLEIYQIPGFMLASADKVKKNWKELSNLARV